MNDRGMLVKRKFDRIFERFEQYHPNVCEKTVDWWPSSSSHITVRLMDGTLMEYCCLDDTIRTLRIDAMIQDSELLRKEIGNNIRAMIACRGIGQSDLAERVGITSAMLSRYIHGNSMPGLDKLYSLASALGCRVEELLVQRYED